MRQIYKAVIAAILLAAPATAQKASKAEQAAVAASPEQVAAVAAVTNDPMETFIEISTEPFYQAKAGLLGIVNNDKFLRAFIDKKTGKVTYQVYVWAAYGGDWANLNRANLQTGEGPMPTEVHRVGSKVLGCSQFGCSQREDIAIDVPEQIVRWAAADAKAGSGQDWLVRIGSQSGQSGDIHILKTEVAGLLIAVDRIKQSTKPMDLGPVNLPSASVPAKSQ